MRNKFNIFISPLILLPVLFIGIFLYIRGQGNFHPITDGEAYRSAQLDKDEFEYYINKYAIKSILNLRKGGQDESWYREEIKFSAEHNIAHYDVPLSAYSGPSEADVRRLMEIFKNAPRPLLIHCRAGADRTGMVASMWKVAVDKEPKSEAKKQLSILYGHFPIGKTSAMDHFFQNWDPHVHSDPEKY